jgi:hypothetical protein
VQYNIVLEFPIVHIENSTFPFVHIGDESRQNVDKHLLLYRIDNAYDTKYWNRGLNGSKLFGRQVDIDAWIVRKATNQ